MLSYLWQIEGWKNICTKSHHTSWVRAKVKVAARVQEACHICRGRKKISPNSISQECIASSKKSCFFSLWSMFDLHSHNHESRSQCESYPLTYLELKLRTDKLPNKNNKTIYTQYQRPIISTVQYQGCMKKQTTAFMN